MLKSKLLPLTIEVVVILSHLGVYLWRPQKMTNFVTPTPSPYFLHSYAKKWTIDHLFFKKMNLQTRNKF